MSAALLGQVLQFMAPNLHCKNKAAITIIYGFSSKQELIQGIFAWFQNQTLQFQCQCLAPKCEGQVKEHPGLTTSQSSPLRLSFVGSAHRLSTELGTGYSAPGARSRGNTWSVECAERGDTHKTTDYRCQHLFGGHHIFWEQIIFGDLIFLEDQHIFWRPNIYGRHNIFLGLNIC